MYRVIYFHNGIKMGTASVNDEQDNAKRYAVNQINQFTAVIEKVEIRFDDFYNFVYITTKDGTTHEWDIRNGESTI